MYKSPIDISRIQEDLDIAFEDGVFKAVQKVGINVDKEELLKALAYDRGQYEQGYRDALKEQPQWTSVKDRLPKEHDSIFANRTHLSRHMWAKESDNVIVYVRFPDGTGRSTEGRLQDGKWWTRVSPMLEPVVTHWMPLPEPPEVKRDETD